MMVKKSEKYTVYLEECRVYSSGTYKILFCVKSIHGNISICMNPENQYKEVEDGTFVLEKVFEQGKKVQPISLRDVEITVSIDTGLNESPIYLHVKILKLNCEGPSTKYDNFEEYSCGKILLQPHRRLFQTVEESYVERKYNGTLHFFTLLENELVKVAAGCMKYSFFFKKVEECEEAEVPVEEEVTIEIGKEVEEDVDVAESEIVASIIQLEKEVSEEVVLCLEMLPPLSFKRHLVSKSTEKRFEDSVKLVQFNLPVSSEVDGELEADRSDKARVVKTADDIASTRRNIKSENSLDSHKIDKSDDSGNENDIKNTSGISIDHESKKSKDDSFNSSTVISKSSASKDEDHMVGNVEFSHKAIHIDNPSDTYPNLPVENNEDGAHKSNSADEELINRKKLSKGISSEIAEVLNSNRNCTPTGLTEENTSAEIPSTQRLIPINESLQDSWERNDGHQSVASLREKNNPSAYRERQNIPINEKNKIEDLHRNALELDIGFPDMNAIKNLLPQYHALQLSPRLHASSVLPHIPIQEPHNTEERSGTPLSLHNPFILSPKTKEELDSHVVAVLDYQTKELDRFREVIQRMGDDIMNLRKEIAKLQHEKSQLVAKLYYAGEGLTYQNEGDENSNSEIVLLKRRLVAEYEVKTELQERVHSLQNDIIKKNEISVSYVQLQTAHELQQKSLQQMQTKMKKCKLMEDTVMKQEQVIEELERKIAEMKAERRAVSGNDGRVKRSSLKKITVGKPSEELNIGKNQLQANVDSIEEKVRMMQRLEQAEGTICALEEQLYNNTRKWATERSMMQRSIGNQQQPQKFLPSNYENVQQYPYQPTNRPQNTLQFPPYTYQQRRNKYD